MTEGTGLSATAEPDFSGWSPTKLYRHGLSAFNGGDYYDAHEYWEELWIGHRPWDRTFIQGLIQLAVGCFHMTNDNLKGGRGLFTKCRPKLEKGLPAGRGLDVSALLTFVDAALEQIESLSSAGDFDWSGLPVLAEPEAAES